MEFIVSYKMNNIKIFNDVEELTKAFAEFIKTELEDKNSYSIALSGGSTPKFIFQYLTKNYKDSIPWSKINFYWGDERCVPPTDEQSNFKLADDNLFKELGIKEDQIFRIKGEIEPIIEAENYSKILEESLPNKNGIPVFDLIWLGLGDDGHTASIFPYEINLFNSINFCEVAHHPISGQKRITLTGKVINNAEKVLFIAVGKNKAEKIKEVFVDKNFDLPATLVNPLNSNLFVFIDREAAKRLS